MIHCACNRAKPHSVFPQCTSIRWSNRSTTLSAENKHLVTLRLSHRTLCHAFSESPMGFCIFCVLYLDVLYTPNRVSVVCSSKPDCFWTLLFFGGLTHWECYKDNMNYGVYFPEHLLFFLLKCSIFLEPTTRYLEPWNRRMRICFFWIELCRFSRNG